MNIFNKKTITIPYGYLVIVFLMPPFMAYDASLNVLVDLWQVIQLMFSLLLLLWYFFSVKCKSMLINLLLLYYFFACCSCVFNGYTPIAIIWQFTADVGIAVFSYRCLKRNYKKFIHVTSNVFFVYLMINTLLIFLYPAGIVSGRIGQVYWFLGGKNTILPYAIICCILNVLDSYFLCGGISLVSVIKIIFCTFVLFLVESSTAIVIMVVVWCVIFLDLFMKNKKMLKYFIGGKTLYWSAFVLCIVIVFFSADQQLLVVFTEWLGKDITFNGRTALWALTLYEIRLNPWWGVGPSIVLDVGWAVEMTHAHNLYLNIAGKFGVPALLSVLCIIRLAFKKIKILPLSVILLFFLYLVASIVEVYATCLLFFLCSVLAFLEVLPENSEVNLIAKS